MSIKQVILRAKQLASQGKTDLSYEDVLAERKAAEIETGYEIAERQRTSVINSILGRSGILPIHQNCSVENYVVSNQGQHNAATFSNRYIENFLGNSSACFIFSGDTGTGKNHLSAAICNKLMFIGKTCLIITVSEMMIKLRKCYGDNAEYSEDQFLKQLIDYDLLILDEIGLTKGSDHEKMILNQVIDQRTGNLKAIGLLTNLDTNEFTEFVGARIIRRLQTNNCEWIVFNWDGFTG